MNLPFYIARRYLFSRKSINIINIISAISMVVVAIVTTAMVVVLSAFNGIEALIDDRFSTLDADITILPVYSKVMDRDSIPEDWFLGLEGIYSAGGVVEENVLAEYESKQRIVRIKGLEPQYLVKSRLDSLIIDGSADVMQKGVPHAILGAGVRYELNARLGESSFFPLQLTSILRGRELKKNLQGALNKKHIMSGGVFSINVDFDTQYMLVPLSFAQDLLQYENEVTGYELNFNPGTNIERTASRIAEQLGEGYQVKTRFQKNELIYKTNRSEKWITFFILMFIMLIATFNIIASLTMLILEKKSDIKVLSGLGAPGTMIRKIFFYEGLLINALGAGAGLLLGYILCWAQQEFGLMPLEGGLVPYYPVAVQGFDFIVVFSVVVFTGVVSSFIPVRIYTRKSLKSGK